MSTAHISHKAVRDRCWLLAVYFFTFLGRYCERKVNECLSEPCLNGANCTDLVASYRCTCTSAYVGRTCATPYCVVNNPCRNGATCYGDGQCRCRPGFVGADCSINLCQLITCHNGGSCVNGSCICPPGIAGSTCDVDICGLTTCLVYKSIITWTA